jgi:hypothetical protein
MDGDNAIQALAEKVDDYLAPQGIAPVTPFSQNGWVVSATTCKAYRFGPFVHFHLDAAKTNWAGAEGVGQLPVGFRPAINCYVFCMISATGGAQVIYVRTDGTIVTVLGFSGGASSLIGDFVYTAA